MATKLSDNEIAEKLTRKRARILPLLAVFFIAGQPVYFSHQMQSNSVPAHLKIGAWLVWTVALLVALAFAGGNFRGARVRALTEDETTRANRLSGYAWGFWAAMGTAIGLYFVSMFDNLKGRESLHLIVTFAIATALIRFGMLERRALKVG